MRDNMRTREEVLRKAKSTLLEKNNLFDDYVNEKVSKEVFKKRDTDLMGQLVAYLFVLEIQFNELDYIVYEEGKEQ